MKTNLAYIDDVLDRTIETRATTPHIPDATRADIRGKAQKCIAGFHLHDEEAEKKMLDDLIAERRKQIDTFRADRTKVRESLSALGITALAVVPTRAWEEICLTSKLFLLDPDKEGRIAIPTAAFKDYTAKEIAVAERKNWPGLLTQFFPGGRTAPTRGAILATLVLPKPPDDVAAILIKAQSLKLSVAAVAEAIRFKETAGELLNRSKESTHEPNKPFRGYASYEEWLRKCPVIYTEQGTAAAILAQFGDFPVEKQVVDAVVASDDLISAKPRPVEEVVNWASAGSLSNMYQRAIEEQMHRDISRAQYEAMRAQQHEALRAAAVSPGRLINSRDWTGI